MLAGILRLSLGEQHSLILKLDGGVWSAGAVIGTSDERTRYHDTIYRFLRVIASGAIAAAAGQGYSMVLKQDDSLWAAGRNKDGQLGDGTRLHKRLFSFVQMIPGATAVAAGGRHSMVLTREGCVWTTGWNKYGQLGTGSTASKGHRRTRFWPEISSGAKAVAAGDVHSIMLKRDGSVWAAGRNYNGQVGDGSRTDRNRFVKVISSGATDVAVGGRHSLVRKQDGSVWATGFNQFGQLGDGSRTGRLHYVQSIMSGAKAVAAGTEHSIMLKQDDSVWTTGYNFYGQLGDRSRTDRVVFVQVISGGATAVAAGGFYSMVLKKDGSIWATGLNHGQFGDGSTSSCSTFTRVVSFRSGKACACFASICVLICHLAAIIHATAGFTSTNHSIIVIGREATTEGVNWSTERLYVTECVLNF